VRSWPYLERRLGLVIGEAHGGEGAERLRGHLVTATCRSSMNKSRTVGYTSCVAHPDTCGFPLESRAWFKGNMQLSPRYTNRSD
jgi:hypothetical protein